MTQMTRWRQRLPYLLIIGWLVFLGVTVWMHAVSGDQPPIYDPLGYIQKGKVFWDKVARGEWFNPLNIDPSSRPPGTILMSYPLGFSPEFAGFHFRSVFFPIVCVVAAVYMSLGLAKTRRTPWGVAGIAFLFSTLPMFYHFELVEGMPGPDRWGLVDTFQGGVAALATAALIRGIDSRSQRWLRLSGVLAALTMLIKPSGGMVMALLGAVWFFMMAAMWLRVRKEAHAAAEWRVDARRGLITLLGIYLVVGLLCLDSKYLSSENFGFAKKALVVMKAALKISWADLPGLLHNSVGDAVLVWIGLNVLLFALFSAYHKVTSSERLNLWGCVAAAIFVWLGGAWYWLIGQAGGNQIRYFYPFVWMGLIFLVPPAIDLWQRRRMFFRTLIVLVCFLPVVNTGLLLLDGNPSPEWQKRSGVSISLGTSTPIINQARDFLRQVRQVGKNVDIYALSSGAAVMTFESVGTYEWYVRPEQPTYKTHLQIDWANGFVTRIEELLSCQYLLFRPMRDAAAVTAALNVREINSFDQENKAFHAWMTGLSVQDGVQKASESENVKVWKISDPRRFARSLQHFIDQRQWRPAFIKENPRIWWSHAEIRSVMTKPVMEDVNFADRYLVKAIGAQPSGQGMNLEFWFDVLQGREKDVGEYAFFFHLIDSGGAIKASRQVMADQLTGVLPTAPWRYVRVSFDHVPKEVTGIGWGIYRPAGQDGFLVADKGVKDWEGKRIVLPLR